LLADSGAQAVHIEIRRILAPALAALLQKIAQLFPSSFKKRPHHRANLRINSRQAFEASPAEQVGQQGFRLIVGSVSDSDARGAAFFDDALKKAISQAPRCVLKIPAVFLSRLCYVLARDFKFEAAPAGQTCYEFCVGFRFRTAKLVVEVDDEESEAQIAAKTLEYPQERDGVCSAGDGHADTVTRRQHPRTADGFQHGLFQW
jgi:hypothetical protein